MSLESSGGAKRDGGVVVLKVGTSSLVNSETGCLQIGTLARLCEVVKRLRDERGVACVIVSSGAVASGCMRAGLSTRPSALGVKQAMAAIGQVSLMRTYDELFSALRLVCAQILLTYDNYLRREEYLNAVATLSQLLKLGVVPVVNENDSVATGELRYGDNDSLSAFVANMVGASHLFLVTDVDALYTADPRTDASAEAIRVADDSYLARFCAEQSAATGAVRIGGGTQWGTGGMQTKLKAAKHAMFCGIETVLLSADDLERIPEALAHLRPDSGEVVDESKAATKALPFGTVFPAQRRAKKLSARKRWLLGLKTEGTVCVDAGAKRALLEERKSLFAVGIRLVTGSFDAGDVVSIRGFDTPDPSEFARGRVNYSSAQLRKIKGKKSKEIHGILGGAADDYSQFAIDRDTLVILKEVATVDTASLSSASLTPSVASESS